MRAQFGGGIDPRLGLIDYSGIARASEIRARNNRMREEDEERKRQAKMEAVGQFIGNIQERKAKIKEEEEAANMILDFAKGDTALASTIKNYIGEDNLNKDKVMPIVRNLGAENVGGFLFKEAAKETERERKAQTKSPEYKLAQNKAIVSLYQKEGLIPPGDEAANEFLMKISPFTKDEDSTTNLLEALFASLNIAPPTPTSNVNTNVSTDVGTSGEFQLTKDMIDAINVDNLKDKKDIEAYQDLISNPTGEDSERLYNKLLKKSKGGFLDFFNFGN